MNYAISLPRNNKFKIANADRLQLAQIAHCQKYICIYLVWIDGKGDVRVAAIRIFGMRLCGIVVLTHVIRNFHPVRIDLRSKLSLLQHPQRRFHSWMPICRWRNRTSPPLLVSWRCSEAKIYVHAGMTTGHLIFKEILNRVKKTYRIHDYKLILPRIRTFDFHLIISGRSTVGTGRIHGQFRTRCRFEKYQISE